MDAESQRKERVMMFWIGMAIGIVAGVVGSYLGLVCYLQRGSWGG